MEEEKIVMCVIEKGKRPNSTRSEGQIAQGVENNAKTDITNKENDESATVDNEVQFEIALVEVVFVTTPTYCKTMGQYCVRSLT